MLRLRGKLRKTLPLQDCSSMAYIQIILNSLASGALLALAAYGFSLIFRITKAFHLAQASVYICGVYAYMYGLSLLPHASFIGPILAFPFAAGLTLLLAWLIEKGIYLPLHARRGNEALTLVGALGVNAVLINLIALLFGNEVKILPPPWKVVPLEPLPDLILTNLQFVHILVALGIFSLLYRLLHHSTLLLTIKAVADDSDLAEVSGVNVSRIRYRAMAGGSLLVLIAGVLRSYDIGIEPYSGMSITLSAAVVAVLTGSIGVWPTVIVAVALSLLQNLTEWFLSAQWREGLTFLCLLLVMLWRTEGVLSYQLRKDA